jgi:hypothetical protein
MKREKKGNEVNRKYGRKEIINQISKYRTKGKWGMF